MKFNTRLNYKRFYTIDSLYNINSFILNARYLKFDSVEVLFKVLYRYPEFNRNYIIEVPITCLGDIQLLSKLNVGVFKGVRLYLDNSLDRDTLEYILDLNSDYYCLVAQGDIIPYIKDLMDTLDNNLKAKSSHFTGIFRDLINISNYKDLPYIYQSPFLCLPIFRYSEVSFDYEDLSKLTLSEVEEFRAIYRYYLSNIKGNLYTSYQNKKIYYEETQYKYHKVVHFKDNKFKILGDDKYISYDNLDSHSIDLNLDRTPYDINYDNSLGINSNFIDIVQNYKCTGSYILPPTLYELLMYTRRSQI